MQNVFVEQNVIENRSVPFKTFDRYGMSTIDGFVPTKTFNWYQMSKQSYFVPHKTFSRDKTRTNCRPHLPTHQDNHTGNRHPSTTISLPSATRTCTPIRRPNDNGTAPQTWTPFRVKSESGELFRVDSPQTVRKVLARLKYPVPLHKARSGFSILTEECLTFRTISPDYP